jgi:glycerophosphodiester phosphodiesterase
VDNVLAIRKGLTETQSKMDTPGPSPTPVPIADVINVSSSGALKDTIAIPTLNDIAVDQK